MEYAVRYYGYDTVLHIIFEKLGVRGSTVYDIVCLQVCTNFKTLDSS